MKKWIKVTLLSVSGILAVLFIVAGIFVFLLATQNDRDNKNPARKKEMTAITLNWGRLADFPKEAKNFVIYTEGSPFTRTFRGSFAASLEEINSWVDRSSGLHDAEVVIISSDKKKYLIKSGGGANSAVVVIDYGIGKVEFEVSWS